MQGCGFKDNGRETGGAGLAEGARTTGHDLARPRRGLPTATWGRKGSSSQLSGYRNTRTASGHRGEF